ncbi:MAG: methylenetetrahydrofolate reductase [Prevotellaceae bacterium]|jgi:methylenetetrahydrofolate reductase (NADPH)|nr:methylenetetrahydrofolate reductase [Prevotellaceae bacterium]
MKVANILRNSKTSLFTFEILPPLKGGNFGEIQQTIEPLLEFSPAYINVTCHRADIAYRTNSKGDPERYTTKKRPGSVGVAAAVKFKYNIEIVPHVICAGFTRDETEDALIDYNYLEMKNLLVLRGDKMKSDPVFIAEKDGHAHAVDLLKQIQNMNKGIYLNSEIENAAPTDFSCGVAGYPEKHADAKTMQQDIIYLKEKVDAGADYIVTQMFFDNSKYFDFVKRCREADITVPIIPGVKPIGTLNQVDVLPKLFNLSLPNDLEIALRKCKTNEEAKKTGTEWLTMQAQELKKANVPAIHIYTFGIPDNVAKVCKAVF